MNDNLDVPIDYAGFGHSEPEDENRWLGVFGAESPRTPELELMWAILKDAVEVLLKVHLKKAHRSVEDAEAWFNGRAALISYGTVCDALGIDNPEALRDGVFRRRRELLQSRAA